MKNRDARRVTLHVIPLKPSRSPIVHMAKSRDNSQPLASDLNNDGSLLADLRSGFSEIRRKVPKNCIRVFFLITLVLLAVKIVRVANGDVSTIREILSSVTISTIAAPVLLVVAQSSPFIFIMLGAILSFIAQRYWTLTASRFIVALIYNLSVLAVEFVILPVASFLLVVVMLLLTQIIMFNHVPSGSTQSNPQLSNTEASDDEGLVDVSAMPSMLSRIRVAISTAWEMAKSIFFVIISITAPPMVIGGAVFSTLLNTSYWGNPQILKVGDDVLVGYVINTTDLSSSLMRDDDRSVVVMKNGDIESIQLCRIYDRDERSLYGVLSKTSHNDRDYPWCYGSPKPAPINHFLGLT